MSIRAQHLSEFFLNAHPQATRAIVWRSEDTEPWLRQALQLNVHPERMHLISSRNTDLMLAASLRIGFDLAKEPVRLRPVSPLHPEGYQVSTSGDLERSEPYPMAGSKPGVLYLNTLVGARRLRQAAVAVLPEYEDWLVHEAKVGLPDSKKDAAYDDPKAQTGLQMTAPHRDLTFYAMTYEAGMMDHDARKAIEELCIQRQINHVILNSFELAGLTPRQMREVACFLKRLRDTWGITVIVFMCAPLGSMTVGRGPFGTLLMISDHQTELREPGTPLVDDELLRHRIPLKASETRPVLRSLTEEIRRNADELRADVLSARAEEALRDPDSTEDYTSAIAVIRQKLRALEQSAKNPQTTPKTDNSDPDAAPELVSCD